MKRKILEILLLGMMFVSCHSETIEMGEAAKYYPPASQLLEGTAFKFYEHDIPKNTGESPSSNISYRTYQIIPPDTLVSKYYDAAMRIKWKTNFQIRDNQFKILDVFYSNLIETAKAEITNDISTDWINDETYADYKVQLKNGYQILFSKQQEKVKDTIIENRPSKIIESIDNFIVISPSNDSTSYPSKVRRIYRENLGLFASYQSTEKSKGYSELIEQMSLADFERRMDHGKKRIAYIDPDQTLDDNTSFEICNEEIIIRDYYNCDNRGQIKGGKGRWWRIVRTELDTDKLKNESGYLTFRFVINCKGEAARFVTEEADLDFREKKFDEETVAHLFEIVSKQKDWQTCNAKGESHDSYAYVTFKLQDGDLIEILP